MSSTAITNSIAANGGKPLTFGSPNGPVYVTTSGAANGFVGSFVDGKIPANTAGVSVGSSRTWSPFFLGLIGVHDWTASSVATAKGGYSLAGPPGTVFPVGVSQATYETFPLCGDDVGSSPACQPVHLTPGSLNIPGGFGWLKFGAAGKCTGFGLGMINDGCANSKPFLQSEIGPPSNSYGCCTAVTHGAPPTDRIGSLPGNKASADCSYYIDQQHHGRRPGLGRRRRNRRQRLVPHRRVRGDAAHRMQRWKGRRRRPSAAASCRVRRRRLRSPRAPHSASSSSITQLRDRGARNVG